MLRRLLILLLPVMLLAAPSAATASDRDVFEVSHDGVHWSPNLTAPLFDDVDRWVPGDTRVETFHIRKTSVADIHLQLTASDSARLLASGDFTLQVRIDGGTWQSVPSEYLPLSVSPGGSSVVDIRGIFEPAAGNETQNERITIGVNVWLEGTGLPTEPGRLPKTGAMVGVGAVAAGICSALVGIALVIRSRKNTSPLRAKNAGSPALPLLRGLRKA